MGIRIRSNQAALNAHRHLAQATNRVSLSMERLSSGLRINRAGQDPAGLAISENIKSDIRALEVATRNAADGIGVVQTADGALDEISNILIRMRELTIQSYNGTNTARQRAHLDKEFQTLTQEISRIGGSTEFNGRNLLDGSAGVLALQVGIDADADATIELDLRQIFTAAGLGLSTQNIASLPGPSAQPVLPALESALTKVSRGRARLGAVQNRLESAIRTNMNYQENLAAANSRIRDVDVAAETSELAGAQILQQAAVSILSQAQQMPRMALSLLGI
ncbi:flagellin FliC [bacterium DOLZORAL124_64_63]|nr:MAG: flagellin FliC [bacterium DOLZORAL124_64_63]